MSGVTPCGIDLRRGGGEGGGSGGGRGDICASPLCGAADVVLDTAVTATAGVAAMAAVAVVADAAAAAGSLQDWSGWRRPSVASVPFKF